VRILLYGRDGQVGWELQRALAPLGTVVPIGRGDAGGDLAHPARVAERIRAVAPDVVVNAAAYTAVDKAEGEQELARTVNAEAPGAMARAAAAVGASFVHYSTDYVFDGSGTSPWDEQSPTAPLGTYGRTKLEGEERVRASGARHLILRTCWVYAARGHNFLRTMLRLARERDSLTVVDDQHGAPTGAELVADVTAHALRMVLAKPELAGTYHLCASGETSWHGYARFVVERARAAGADLRVESEAVRPVPSTAYPTAARRPGNSRLRTHRLESCFGLSLPPWQDGVERTLAELLGR
jgi:dTDP-4-dehydrorhamnose reductase